MTTETLEKPQTTETPQATEQTPSANPEHEALKKLGVDELIGIIAETRSEAKQRRLKAKELEEKMALIDQENKQKELKTLEETNQYKTLYEKIKEEYKDYDELKTYKQTILEKSKIEVENTQKQLTAAEKELYDIVATKMTYDEQLDYIKKLIASRQTASIIDTTQSVARSNKVKEEVKNPLRSPGGIDPILDGLASLRKQTK
jgi:hypothetical protein